VVFDGGEKERNPLPLSEDKHRERENHYLTQLEGKSIACYPM